MMDLLPPVGWADVARRDDVDRLERRVDDRMDRLDDRMDRLDARMDRLDGRMERLEIALREQTRFYVVCLFAAVGAVSTIVGIAGM